MWLIAGLAGSRKMKEQLCAKTGSGSNAGLLKNDMVFKTGKIVGWENSMALKTKW